MATKLACALFFVVLALSMSCGIANGLTGGRARSPFAQGPPGTAEGEGEGPPAVEPLDCEGGFSGNTFCVVEVEGLCDPGPRECVLADDLTGNCAGADFMPFRTDSAEAPYLTVASGSGLNITVELIDVDGDVDDAPLSRIGVSGNVQGMTVDTASYSSNPTLPPGNQVGFIILSFTGRDDGLALNLTDNAGHVSNAICIPN
ncbi:MAG: hypothetical protein Q8O67_03530 [Deltaproteobacteria bacterium]|nr:hypothetical protein [Deltaproteobacteria bacterium]